MNGRAQGCCGAGEGCRSRCASSGVSQGRRNIAAVAPGYAGSAGHGSWGPDSHLVGPLAAEAGGRQHGAVPRGGTEFPSHACMLFLKEAARTRRPAAVLFTDLASALYSALPELALGAILTSQKRAQEELIRSVDTVIKRQEVAECWRKMAADFHKEPWFWESGSRKHVHTFVGTRLDAVFALTFLAFQNSLQQFLRQVEATICVPRRCGGIFGTGEVGQETLPCPTYMDDLTITMEADSCESVLVKLAMVTEGSSRIVGSDQGRGRSGDLSWPSRTIDRLRCFRSTRVWTMMAMSSFLRWQRMTEQCGSCSPIAILGRLCKLGLAWDGRSHHVPTLDRRRRVRCQGGSWAPNDFHDTCGSRRPKHEWLREVCIKRERGTSCKATSCIVLRWLGADRGASFLGPIGRRPQDRVGSPMIRCRRNCRSLSWRMSFGTWRGRPD